jgi:hypothetical protein
MENGLYKTNKRCILAVAGIAGSEFLLGDDGNVQGKQYSSSVRIWEENGEGIAFRLVDRGRALEIRLDEKSGKDLSIFTRRSDYRRYGSRLRDCSPAGRGF